MTFESLVTFARSVTPAAWAGVTTTAAAIITAGCCWRGRKVTKQSTMVTHQNITDAIKALKPTGNQLKVGAPAEKNYLLTGDREVDVVVEFPSEQALANFLVMEKKKQVEKDPINATKATLTFTSVSSLPSEEHQQELAKLFPMLLTLLLKLPSGQIVDWKWTVPLPRQLATIDYIQ